MSAVRGTREQWRSRGECSLVAVDRAFSEIVSSTEVKWMIVLLYI